MRRPIDLKRILLARRNFLLASGLGTFGGLFQLSAAQAVTGVQGTPASFNSSGALSNAVSATARRGLLSLFAWIILSSAASAGFFCQCALGGLVAGTWQPPAMSSNGAYIYVPTFPDSILGNPPGYIHSTSTTGATWARQTNWGNRFWVVGCTSSDGTIVYEADQGSGSGGLIYKSVNGGAPTATNFPQLAWQQVSCDNSGADLVGCVGTQSTRADLFTSVDGGNTVIDQTTSLSRDYTSCVISGDGTKIAASNEAGQGPNGDGCIYVSINWQSGSPTWTENICAANGSTFASNVAYCRTGSTLYAGFNANGNSSHVFKSTNDGGSWTDVNPPGGTAAQRNWFWVACDADGQVATASNYDYLYVYTSGTWGPQLPISPNGPGNHQNGYQAISDNGQIIVNAVYAAYIYVSQDGGSTFPVTNASP